MPVPTVNHVALRDHFTSPSYSFLMEMKGQDWVSKLCMEGQSKDNPISGSTDMNAHKKLQGLKSSLFF